MQKFDSSKLFQKGTKADLKPSAQINKLCDTGNAEFSKIIDIVSLIERIKEESNEVYVIAMIQISFGLRISEVLNIRYSDLLGCGNVKINGLKGSNNRIINTSLLNTYEANNNKSTYKIFEHFDRYFIYRMYKKYGISFNSIYADKTNVTHALRHIYINNLRANNISNEDIKTTVGHKNIKNTLRYGNEQK